MLTELGITGNIIAAIIYDAATGKFRTFNQHFFAALDETSTHFSKNEGIEFQTSQLKKILEGEYGQHQIDDFKKGSQFINRDELADQFAIYGNLYFPDKSIIPTVARRILDHFIESLESRLLRDPKTGLSIVANYLKVQNQSSREEARKTFNSLKKLELKLCKISEQIGDISNRIGRNSAFQELTEEEKKFEEEYLEQVGKEFGRIRMYGIREYRDIKQVLNIAYVSLRAETVGQQSERENQSADSLMFDEELLVIRGPAGSGKTTLLNWVACKCAIQEEKNPWNGSIPFMIPLRRVANKEKYAPDISELIDYTIDPKLWPKSAPKNWIMKVIQKKRAVLLLDGVDELPPKFRVYFWDWVDDFNTRYPGNRIYITSRFLPGITQNKHRDLRNQERKKMERIGHSWPTRPLSLDFLLKSHGDKSSDLDKVTDIEYEEVDDTPSNKSHEYEELESGFEKITDIDFEKVGDVKRFKDQFKYRLMESNFSDGWSPPKSFKQADLEAMSNMDILIFINNWHNAILIQTSDEVEQNELQESSQDLHLKLQQIDNRKVLELCKSPLLCALICALHWRESGYLPKRRIELYDRCCTMLLEERDIKRQIVPPAGPLQHFTLKDKEMLLQRLALDMMRNGTTFQEEGLYQVEVTRKEALTWIAPSLRSCDNEEMRECSPEIVLDYLIERTGLLREPSQGRIDFPHRTFQEYLAACAVGALNQAHDVIERLPDDQWHEVIVLAAGTKIGGVLFGNILIEKLVNKGESKESSNLTKYACFVLAVACLDTANQIDEHLRTRVLSHLKEIVPPKNTDEARLISSAGSEVLKLLKYQDVSKLGIEIVTHCVKSISLVNGSEARNMLTDPNGYGSVNNENLVYEIASCPGINPIEVPQIFQVLQAPSYDLAKRIEELLAEVKDINPISRMPKVSAIKFKNWIGLETITELELKKELKRLALIGLDKLEDFSPIMRLSGLTNLVLGSCKLLDNLDFLEGLIELRTLTIVECDKLVDINKIQFMKKLEALSLVGLKKVSNLTVLQPLNQLQTLSIINLNEIENLNGLEGLKKVRKLRLMNCENLRDIRALKGLNRIENLKIESCKNISEFEALKDLSELEVLSLAGCDNLEDLSFLECMPKLRVLDLHNCYRVKDYSQLLKTKIYKIGYDGKKLKRLSNTLRIKNKREYIKLLPLKSS